MKLHVMLILVLFSTAHAQQPLGPRQDQPQEDPQFIYFEVIRLPASDPSSCRIDIPYRIDREFFVAVRNTDPAIPYPFVRRGEVYLDLLDNDGVSKARDIHRFEIGEQEAEPKPEVKRWREGFASFSVPPGKYTLVLEVVDLESKRRFLNRDRTIIAEADTQNELSASTPLFVEPASADARSLRPVNFGGDVLFGDKAHVFVWLASPRPSDSTIRVEYTISTKPFFQQEAKQLQSDTLDVALLQNPYPVRKNGYESVRYVLEPSPLPSVGAFILPLNVERLPLRPFTLKMTIRQGSRSTTITRDFAMVWPDMPVSLRDVDFALDALRHVTREEELDSLKRGSRDTRLRNLEQYWRSKDKTPETEYNEMMVEYYRRVDYTMRAFSSIRGDAGYRTDRGRIYILYGPPTNVERRLDPKAGPLEIWVYEKQNRRYVFADQSKTGNYTLIATQNL